MHRGIASDYFELLVSRKASEAFTADPDNIIDWQDINEQLRRVPEIVDESAEDPVPGYGALTDEQAYIVASIAAKSVHARLHYSANCAIEAENDIATSIFKVSACETSYADMLTKLHHAALEADHQQAIDLFYGWLDEIVVAEAAIKSVRLLRATDRKVANIGFRSADIVRRYAMLTAGIIQVVRRLSTSRGASGMKRIAENREQIRRYEIAQWLGGQSLADLDLGENQVVMGEVAEMGWVNRPEIPYSFVRLSDGAELRIHRKDIKQSGVIPGSHIWVRGKVELAANDEKILVAHFEGPGSHASEYWEDWLADEVRNAYDLYPKVVDANWELPVNNLRYAAGDLISRVWRSDNG